MEVRVEAIGLNFRDVLNVPLAFSTWKAFGVFFFGGELWVLGSFPRKSKWIMLISKLFGQFSSDLTSEVMGMYPGDPGDPGLDCSGTVSRPQWVGVSLERLGSGPGELKYVENFHPYVGEDEPNLTNIFQMGWFNHQPGEV